MAHAGVSLDSEYSDPISPCMSHHPKLLLASFCEFLPKAMANENLDHSLTLSMTYIHPNVVHLVLHDIEEAYITLK
jgi:hypothetical protein